MKDDRYDNPAVNAQGVLQQGGERLTSSFGRELVTLKLEA
jgi:hypothetical protein